MILVTVAIGAGQKCVSSRMKNSAKRENVIDGLSNKDVAHLIVLMLKYSREIIGIKLSGAQPSRMNRNYA